MSVSSSSSSFRSKRICEGSEREAKRIFSGSQDYERGYFGKLTEDQKAAISLLTKNFNENVRQFCNQDPKILRTFLRVHESFAHYAYKPGDHLYYKKWKEPDTPSFSIQYSIDSDCLSGYLMWNRVYKNSGAKKVFETLCLPSGLFKATTMLPLKNENLNEVSFPKALETHNCKYLVPPFEHVSILSTAKGGKKIMALGELYFTDCSKEKLSIANQIKAVLAAAKGALYLHSKGWAHRDIKPENIFKGFDGTFKLGDYGLACQLGARNYAGTILFASPESFLGWPVSEKAAVWEIAMTGFRLLGVPVNNRVLFESERPEAITDEAFEAKINEAPKPQTYHVQKELFDPLFEIYKRCVRKNPGDRPSVERVIEELENLNAKLPPLPSAAKAAQG